MNKEAELPKSIDFSQLPEAPRAFKAGEGHTRTHTHTHTQAWTHMYAHIQTHVQTERERSKSERIMAPAVAVSLKTQFGLSRFPTGHRSPDKRTHSEPTRFCSLLLGPAVKHSTFCTMLSHTHTYASVHAERWYLGWLQLPSPPGPQTRRETSVKNLFIIEKMKRNRFNKRPGVMSDLIWLSWEIYPEGE